MKAPLLYLAAGLALGAALGWIGHMEFIIERPSVCHDEFINVDMQRSASHCSHVDATPELKDGYLTCRCKRGK